jgi:hypothetical protein
MLGLQAALLLAFASTSIALVAFRVEPNDTLISRLELIRNATTPNAAFGDSHIVWGVVGSPALITLGTEGETIPDMELRVDYYFKNKSPGRVIIQGDPHSFAAYKLERGTHEYLEDMGSSFWSRFVGHHRPYLGQYWQRVIAGRSLDVFRPKYELRWGWVVGKDRWSAVDPATRATRAEMRFRRQTPIDGFERHEFAESYRRILASLQRRGAKTCVVTTPVSHDYYVHASRGESTARVIRFYEEVARQHGARYVNGFGIYAEPRFNEYFTDEDHLNEIGAPRFTERLLASCFDG